ncbi:MAG TPA: hydrogenase maturation nickel metallochaperone HypA [Gammaproteobacteria bacterium]
MHELSLCRSLRTQLERLAAEHQGRSICRVTLRLGPLAGVEPRLLAAAFPLAMAGGVAAHAQLVIDTAPLQVRCASCGRISSVPANRLCCPACESRQTQLLGGDELLLTGIELEPRSECDVR